MESRQKILAWCEGIAREFRGRMVEDPEICNALAVMADTILAALKPRANSTVECLPLKQYVGGSNPPPWTKT